MFNLIIVAILTVLGLIGVSFENEIVNTTGIVFLIGSFVWIMIALISNFSQYTSQMLRFENLRADKRKITLQEEVQKQLIAEFKSYLGEKYPEFEKEIFKNFKTQPDATTVILNYPEIKTSKGLRKLVDKINDLVISTNNSKRYLESSCATIRYYNVSKWELLKATIPADLELTIL